MHFKLPGLCVDVNKCPLNLNCNFNVCKTSQFQYFRIQLNDFDFCRIYSFMFETYIAWIIFFRSRFLLIIFTISRKRASDFTPGVFQGVCFEVFVSFMQCFGIIIKEKCSPFDQGIIQQPITSINKVITPMTELSDPPSSLSEIVFFIHHGVYYNLFVCP